MSSDSDSATMTPSKNKLRVSHHPSTFLKPTLTALQNEAGRNFQESLLIVEDEAIEMLSSPFRSSPKWMKMVLVNWSLKNLFL